MCVKGRNAIQAKHGSLGRGESAQQFPVNVKTTISIGASYSNAMPSPVTLSKVRNMQSS